MKDLEIMNLFTLSDTISGPSVVSTIFEVNAILDVCQRKSIRLHGSDRS